jgi:serine-type D-Ala-D-Ala carboxypeptidase/endopeptidase (penicillin-binding protein 4)
LKRLYLLILVFANAFVQAQDVKSTFTAAYKKFTYSKNLQHAISGIYVINTSNGNIVAEENAQVGFAPASCQKVIVASAALELLGPKYTYRTRLGYRGSITNNNLNGDIFIQGSGDPTLGSWRYPETGEDTIISIFTKALSRAGINAISGDVYADEDLWKGEVTPDGWIWQDIGSYYGAGARALNWRENQYDLFLKSGSHIGDSLSIVRTDPVFVSGLNLRPQATSGATGSGDNAYIYFPLNDTWGYVRGTIPINENLFSISGATPHPARQLAITLEAAIKKLPAAEAPHSSYTELAARDPVHFFYTYSSPPLDSIVYWFLKKSINLYGEALVKTLGYQYAKTGATDSGVSIVKGFWSTKHIDPASMNIIDGSGLSPANRVTPAALVSVMEYARKQQWFSAFYEALPEINGIKMKSGSIGGVVSYTGYIKSKTGMQYTFAFIVNNFDGEAGEVRKKMFALLDLLK